MFSGLETGFGLELVLALQAAGNGLFDALAQGLHALGGDIFFLIVLTLIYWCLDRRLGARLLFVLLFAGILNGLLKLAFATPRPFQVSDAVRMLVEQDGYGMPSGHVMLAVAVWGYLALALRRRWLTLLVGVYVLLMAWARMYAGVHYPQDVIGGALFGLLALGAFVWLEARVPPLWARLKAPARLALVGLVVLWGFVFLFSDDDGTALVGILAGVGLGAALLPGALGYSAAGSPAQRAARYALGIAVTLVLFLGLRALLGALALEPGVDAVLRLARYALVGIWAYALYPLVAQRAGLLGRPADTPTHAAAPTG